MVEIIETELNPFEQAIELRKKEIKRWTEVSRFDLVKLWKQELDKWLKAYHNYCVVTSN